MLKNGDIGFYLQSYNQLHAVDKCLEGVRKFYPDSPIRITSDNGEKFTKVAEKHNAEYKHYFTNCGYKWDKHGAMEYFTRVHEFVLNNDIEFVVILEDDIMIRDEIKIDPSYYGAVAGVRTGNFFSDKVMQHLRDIDGWIHESGRNQFGACGGTIIDASVVLDKYEKIMTYTDTYFDEVLEHCPGLGHIDLYTTLAYNAVGVPYVYNNNIIEILRRPDWESTNHPIVHQYKEHYFAVK